MSGIRICVCLRLGDAQSRNHIVPLADHPGVECVHVVRHAPVPGLTHSKVRQHTVGNSLLPIRLMKMFAVCRRLAKSGEANAVVSFNPLPYGLLAIAAFGRSPPYHLGFIGSDWYGRRRRSVWKRLRAILKGASFVTATGQAMSDELVSAGVCVGRVAVLPHAIDADRFTPGNPAAAEYDAIYVGQLIKRKRVDLILSAVSLLAGRGRRIRLCVVGDGPERGALEAMSKAMGIAGQVDFVGQSDAVETYLRRSRIFVMASDMEGFPFAIVEAMCCGLVPVSTDVGTIRDHVTDGENGFLVGRGDAAALADRIGRLLDEPELYARMRARSLEMRLLFSYERATAVWDKWVSGLIAGQLRQRQHADGRE